MRYTEAAARRESLLRSLAQSGYVSSGELAREFDVTEMTIRRDIAQLHDEGLVERVLGGARVLGPRSFDERTREHTPAKAAVATATSALLDVGTIALDAGSTAALIVGLVPPGSTIVSHSAPVLAAAEERDDVDLIALGGRYQRSTRSFIGPEPVAAIAELAIDVAIISVTGIDDGQLLVADALESAVKRALISAARRVIVVADSTKFSTRAPIRLAGLGDIDIIVTDDGLSTSLQQQYGSILHVAPLATERTA